MIDRLGDIIGNLHCNISLTNHNLADQITFHPRMVINTNHARLVSTSPVEISLMMLEDLELVSRFSYVWVDEVEATGLFGVGKHFLDVDGLSLEQVVWGSDGGSVFLLRLNSEDVVHADGPAGMERIHI